MKKRWFFVILAGGGLVSGQTPGKKGGGPPTESVRPAASRQIRTSVTGFPLDQANVALDRIRHGQLQGAAVLDLMESK